MKMTENRKKKGAAVLAAVMMFAAAGFSSVYGAQGIEIGRNCSLSFELNGEYEELNHMEIPVKLYQVAKITPAGEYEPLAGYESLELGTVDENTTADAWERFAQEASELTSQLGAEPEAELTIAPDEEGVPSARAENLSTGMYLVEAELLSMNCWGLA